MSELALTLLRIGFLVALWVFVIITILVLRRDLRQPADAKPISTRPVKPPKAPKAPKAPKPVKVKTKGLSLVVTEGPLAGTVVPLGTEQITLGRAPDSTLVIDDDYASSRHARIYPSEGAWFVEDLGSTNGTWIERARITSPTVLAVGAPLRIGRTTLQLQK